MCADRSSRSGSQAGVSLVELMIALLIATLIGLAALTVTLAQMGTQRQAVGTGAAAAAAVTALGAVKAEIASATLGFTIDGKLRCTSLNMVEGATVFNGIPFLPLSVTRNPATQSDILVVMHATDPRAAAPVRIAAPIAPTAGSVSLTGWSPATAGERVMIVPSGSSEPCTVREVESATAAVPGGAPHTLSLVATAASFGSPGSYAADAEVIAVGRLQRTAISLNVDGQLELDSSESGAGPVALLDNVVAWRVQYGVATTGGGLTEIAWKNPVDATGTDNNWAVLTADKFKRVRALRVGVVVRNPQAEKGCQATAEKPVLFGTEVNLPADWKCFRYRRAETIVPVRNIAWGES